jgi:hypothetical protein
VPEEIEKPPTQGQGRQEGPEPDQVMQKQTCSACWTRCATQGRRRAPGVHQDQPYRPGRITTSLLAHNEPGKLPADQPPPWSAFDGKPVKPLLRMC